MRTLLLSCLAALALPVAAQTASVDILPSGAPSSAEPFYPRLSLEGSTVVGQSFSLSVRNAGPSNLGFLVQSAAPAPVFSEVLGATVWTSDPLVVQPFTVGASIDASGVVVVESLPPALAGLSLTAQAATFSAVAPGSFRITDAIEFSFGIPAKPADALAAIGYSTSIFEASDVTFGNIDDDGVLDLVMAKPLALLPQVVSVLGSSGGEFSTSLPSINIDTGSRALLVDVAGSLTRDELVQWTPGGSTVEVLASNGINQFSSAIFSFETSGELREVRAADVDGDGDRDLVTLSFFPPTIEVWENTTGVLESMGAVGIDIPEAISLSDPFQAAGPTPFAVEDIDSDGVVDYALTNGRGELRIVAGTPSGPASVVFTRTLSQPGDETDLDVADFDGDGQSDLALAYGNATVGPFGYEILREPLGGQLSPSLFVAVPSPANALEIADLDSDGDLDVLAVSGGADLLADAYVVRTDGPIGGFMPFASPQPLVLGAPLIGQALDDVDADGDLDLIAVSGDPAVVTVVEWTSEGRFATPRISDFEIQPDQLKLADVDGDGLLDAVTRSSSTGQLWRHLGLGDGRFAAPEPIALFTAGGLFELADLDLDGDPDLIIAPDTGGAVRPRLFANVDGEFVNLSVSGDAYSGRPEAILVGDFGQDAVGPVEIAIVVRRVTTSPERLSTRIFRVSTDSLDDVTSVFLFAPPTEDFEATFFGPVGAAGIDTNDDGILELLVQADGLPSGAILVRTAAPFSGLSAVETVMLSTQLPGVGIQPAVDLNLDGRQESTFGLDSLNRPRPVAVVGGSLEPSGFGDGATPGLSPRKLLTGRIDAGDYPDLLVLEEDGVAQLAMGRGAEGGQVLTVYRPLPLGNQLADVALGDLDGDGRDEIVGLHFGVMSALLTTVAAD